MILSMSQSDPQELKFFSFASVLKEEGRTLSRIWMWYHPCITFWEWLSIDTMTVLLNSIKFVGCRITQHRDWSCGISKSYHSHAGLHFLTPCTCFGILHASIHKRPSHSLTSLSRFPSQCLDPAKGRSAACIVEPARGGGMLATRF